MSDDPEIRRRAGSLEALRALSHPLRLRMWSLLSAAPASAAELARALEVEHASASYHLRSLHDAGLVTLAGERTVRGGRERRYRIVEPLHHPVHDDPTSTEDWLALVAAFAAMLQQRAARVSTAPKWFIDAEFPAPPDAVARARERMHTVLDDLRQEALDANGPHTCRVSVSALIFELNDDPGGSGG